MPRWLKYDSALILPGSLVDKEQPPVFSPYEKPKGFWITDDSEDCWRSFCLENRFRLEKLTHKHEVDLDESRVLILRTVEDVREFSRRYGAAIQISTYTFTGVFWHEVAQSYSGVVIAPYQHVLRLAEGFQWYYGWDCASGCIWGADAIRDIRLVEVDWMSRPKLRRRGMRRNKHDDARGAKNRHRPHRAHGVVDCATQ